MALYQYVGEALQRTMGDSSQPLLPFVSNVVMKTVESGAGDAADTVKAAIVDEIRDYVTDGVEGFVSDVVDYARVNGLDAPTADEVSHEAEAEAEAEIETPLVTEDTPHPTEVHDVQIEQRGRKRTRSDEGDEDGDEAEPTKFRAVDDGTDGDAAPSRVAATRRSRFNDSDSDEAPEDTTQTPLPEPFPFEGKKGGRKGNQPFGKGNKMGGKKGLKGGKIFGGGGGYHMGGMGMGMGMGMGGGGPVGAPGMNPQNNTLNALRSLGINVGGVTGAPVQQGGFGGGMGMLGGQDPNGNVLV